MQGFHEQRKHLREVPLQKKGEKHWARPHQKRNSQEQFYRLAFTLLAFLAANSFDFHVEVQFSASSLNCNHRQISQPRLIVLLRYQSSDHLKFCGKSVGSTGEEHPEFV